MNKQIKKMNSAENYTSATSQRDLAAGVLKQVAQDLRRFHGRASAVERELYLDAYRWLVSEDVSWPFSFLNVCHLLNLASEAVREELLGNQSLGVFGYCVRRCGRAARKFQTFLSSVFTSERNLNAAEPGSLAHAAH
jgi:hypothetical protein